MKMYKAQKLTNRNKIVIVEIERKTEISVWVNGKREPRNSDFHDYFETFSEAKDCLLALAEDNLTTARRNLENAQGYMGNIKGLKEI